MALPPVGAGPRALFNPAQTSAAHNTMRDRLWELRTVFGGTEALRAAGETMMPRFERESYQDHRARLKGANLLRNMFRQGVERTAGRLFMVPTALNPRTPGEAITEGSPAWAVRDNADLRGNSFDRVARNYATDALKLGLSHLLVDYPVVEARNLAEERRLAPRPYVVALAPEQVLEAYEDDLGNCTYLRYYQAVVGWDADARVPVVTETVIERLPGRRITWEQVSEAATFGLNGPVRVQWQQKSDVRVSQQRIMLHTLYAEREAHLVGRTPLTECKDLTKEMWQVGSDLKNCLQRVLFPLLTVTGLDQKEVGNIVLGPQSILGSQNKDAKFTYTEHTGKAIESGENYLEGLERRSEAFAGSLTQKSGDQTATAAAIGTSEATSWTKDFGLSLQDKLQAVVDDMTLWQPAINGPRVAVNLEFAVDLPDGDLTELGSARRAGDLDRRTYWTELQRRQVLSPDFNADDAEAALESEQAESMARETEMMRQTAAIEAPRQTGGAPEA